MNFKHLVLLSLTAVSLSGCYTTVDLDDYREDGGENLLVVNLLASPDEPIAVSATRTWFYPDPRPTDPVDTLSMWLSINGATSRLMAYNPATSRYESDITASVGDAISLRTLAGVNAVSATTNMPCRPTIVDVETTCSKHPTAYSRLVADITYSITFDDPADDENYYFIDISRLGMGIETGSFDFAKDFVFEQLAQRVSAVTPGWKPESGSGLPFSDEGIDGRHYTLTLVETLNIDNLNPDYLANQGLTRTICLSAISKSYFDYLVTLLAAYDNQGLLHGGLIDLGIASPVEIYSNVHDGLGIVGAFATTTHTLSVRL